MVYALPRVEGLQLENRAPEWEEEPSVERFLGASVRHGEKTELQ